MQAWNVSWVALTACFRKRLTVLGTIRSTHLICLFSQFGLILGQSRIMAGPR
jgi:hypothetical protein